MDLKFLFKYLVLTESEKGYSTFVLQFLTKSFSIYTHKTVHFHVRGKIKRGKKYAERTIFASLTEKYRCFQYTCTAGQEALSAGYAGPSLEYTKRGTSNNIYLFSD